jgi:hypothetical protein
MQLSMQLRWENEICIKDFSEEIFYKAADWKTKK